MKKITAIIFYLGVAGSILSQEVISSQGSSYFNSAGTLNFTLGETVIETGTNGTIALTQGFHQSSWNFLGIEDLSPQYRVSIFPNPTSDYLYLETDDFENVVYEMVDVKGSTILRNELQANQTALNVAHLSPGNYTLHLYRAAEPLKIFKLIKTSK